MGKMSITTGFPLLCHPSLTGGVARRRVRPRPVFSLRQPMQAQLLSWEVRSGESGHEKSLKAWLSRVTARSLSGENQSLRLQLVVSAVTVTRTV